MKVVAFLRVTVVEINLLLMLFGKFISMNNDTSALLHGSVFIKTLSLHQVVKFLLRVLQDVDLVGNGSSSGRLVSSDHDNFDAC